MKILMVTAEASPVIKVGGLGDMVSSLSKELITLGHDVRIMIPGYSILDKTKIEINPVLIDFRLNEDAGYESINVFESVIKGRIKLYIVENKRYFNDGVVYGENELEKFLFFSRAAVYLLPDLEWQPDIVHCHDWHTGLVNMFVKKDGLPFHTVFTIHNLAYAGWFDSEFIDIHNLERYWEGYSSEIRVIPNNFLAQSILNSDSITTVSQNYAKEILIPGNGNGLDEILNYRRDAITGIVNGIDYEEYNPATDKYLIQNYNDNNLDGKQKNKMALQEKLRLKEDIETPLIGFVQRLEEQKGIDILCRSLETILKNDNVQFVVLGKGRENYERYLTMLASMYPGKMAVEIGFNDPLAHLINGGCDINLIPSLFEPCGLGQLIAMRYGTLPVVRHTGGLIDTVPSFNGNMTEGSGFVFYRYSPESLGNVITKALKKFEDRTAWQSAARRVMQIDFSWCESAKKYDILYSSLPVKGQFK